MLERADATGDKQISYAEWICYLSQAEKSGRYSVEELQIELGFFLKGTGASRLESMDKLEDAYKFPQQQWVRCERNKIMDK